VGLRVRVRLRARVGLRVRIERGVTVHEAELELGLVDGGLLRGRGRVRVRARARARVRWSWGGPMTRVLRPAAMKCSAMRAALVFESSPPMTTSPSSRS